MKTSFEHVASLIDRDELRDLALALGNIPSPPGGEAAVGQYLYDWLAKEGLSPRKVGMFPDRFNVVATLPGAGEGASLLFNAHMDTSKYLGDASFMRNPADPVWHSAWQDGEMLVGDGVVNDKGPMAAFLLSAKAIRKAGVKLKGDLVLTMVCGEIGQEPVDEFTAPQYLSKEVGARYMVSRGVIADYAIVAEGTDFNWAWAGAGKAFFKMTVYGRGMYTPLLPARTLGSEPSLNAIVRMASLIPAIEAWAAEYETRHTQDTPGGRMVPKVNIGAIRGGHPARILSSPEVCSVYVDVRLAPSSDALGIKAELLRLLRDSQMEGEVELFTYRRPQVAQGVEPLCDAITRAHELLGMEKPGMARAEHSSMWRDHIPMIEAGIAAITYGPGAATGGPRLAMRIDDLVKASRAFALIAMDICNRPRAAALTPSLQR